MKWKCQSAALALLSLCWLNPAEAQTITVSSPGDPSFFSGQVYQGTRRKGLKQTSSQVTLPNLNEILSPAPAANPAPKITHVTQPRAVQPSPRKTSSADPKFGYGSGSETSSEPSGPTGFDATAPVDPGYQPQPRPTAGDWQTIPPGTQINIRDSVIHVNTGNQGLSQPQVLPAASAYPFAHNYYPRSYTCRIPYAYSAYPVTCGFTSLTYPYYINSPYCGSSYFGSSCYGSYPFYGGVGCGTALGGLRGFYTSSRNYLSGFGRWSRPGFSFGIRF